MKQVKIDYRPTPKQIMFHASPANEILFGGAAGGGKTKALIMDAFMRCLQAPNTRAYIFRRTFKELEDTDIREARASYPKELATYNVGRHEFLLINGSKILFNHCEHVADKFDYSGAEIDFLYFDELTGFEQEIYDFIKTRLRSKTLSGVTPVVRSASNPGNIGHIWVKDMFVDSGPYMELRETIQYSETLNEHKKFTIQYIPALATENPHITKDYIFELERKPEKLRRALLFGHWDAFEGQVFTEFVNDPRHYVDRVSTHVIDPFEIPMHWPRYMSFDHGYTAPSSIGWWAVDPKGRLYRYREWYVDGLTPRQLVDGILERERKERADNIHIIRVADPHIFDTESNGLSVAMQMAPNSRNGLLGLNFRTGDNARIAGKMQLHERLRFDKNGYPMLYIFTNCEDWIRTVPNLPYSRTKPEDVDSLAEDHCVIGETEVLTNQGWLQIKSLCDTMGYVVSHDGLYHKYYDCRKTQKNVEVFSIETDDGKTVQATANHRFMLADGTWKRLDELQVGDDLMEARRESIYLVPNATGV
jgi:hypothetical protein